MQAVAARIIVFTSEFVDVKKSRALSEGWGSEGNAESARKSRTGETEAPQATSLPNAREK